MLNSIATLASGNESLIETGLVAAVAVLAIAGLYTIVKGI